MTTVLIVDDHPLFRDGLPGLLATLPEIEVTGTAGTASEAITAIKRNPPDVVLMDINLPGTSRRRSNPPGNPDRARHRRVRGHHGR
jgi:DNA-binding NarL/FixJ family response regulator